MLRRVFALLKVTFLVLGAALVLVGFAIPGTCRPTVQRSHLYRSRALQDQIASFNILCSSCNRMERSIAIFGSYLAGKEMPRDSNAPATNSPCGGPLTYCAPTSFTPFPIPQTPPQVSTIDPFTGKSIMFRTRGRTRLPCGFRMEQPVKKPSFGLFYAGQSDPAVRSPMLGTRASQNCDHGSPTCYYMRVIGSGAVQNLSGWMEAAIPPRAVGRWVNSAQTIPITRAPMVMLSAMLTTMGLLLVAFGMHRNSCRCLPATLKSIGPLFRPLWHAQGRLLQWNHGWGQPRRPVIG